MTAYGRRKTKTAAQTRRNPPPGVAGHKPKPVRRKRVNWEGQEQVVLVRWLLGERQRGTPVGALYDVTYHVPNGGARHKKTAADMKNQGAKAGVSDLVVMDARGGWHGLNLELKATPPRHSAISDSQRAWLALGEKRGYCPALARGLEQAKQVLREYAAWQATDEHQGERETLQTGTEWRKA